MKLRKNLSLLLLLSLLLTLAACVPSGTQDTTPSTDPVETTTPTEPPETTPPTEPEETTAPTEPEETEPVETEPQSREPEGTRMSLDQLQLFQWTLAEDEEHWYTVLFGTTFTRPSEMKVRNFFGNGMPYSPEAELTQAERAALEEQRGGELNYEVWRISREKVEEVLENYLNLSPDKFDKVDWSGMYYLESTDCYYGHDGGSFIVWPIFREGYILDDNTRVIYYTHYMPGEEGSEGSTLYRAVLWEDPELQGDPWKILEITKVDTEPETTAPPAPHE